MPREYNYDESGDTTLFFIMTVLSIYVISATLSRLSSWRANKSSEIEVKAECECKNCLLKQEFEKRQIKSSWKSKLPSYSTLFYMLATITLFYLIYRSNSVKTEEVYDPYVVLGLSYGADMKEIKRKYRELSLVLHPDKNPDDPEANSKFISLSKAYDALTDEATRENFEKYGNPDGPTAPVVGIALPAWMMKKQNHIYIIVAYVIMMIVLVVFVAKRWSRSKKYVSDKVLVQTLRWYFQCICNTENATPRLLLEFLSYAEEFQQDRVIRHFDQELLPALWRVVKNIDDGLRKVNEKKLFSHGLGCGKARIFMLAQQYRRDPDLIIPDPLLPDFNSTISKMPQFVNAMLGMLQQADLGRKNECLQYRMDPAKFDGHRKPSVPRFGHTVTHLLNIGACFIQGMHRDDDTLNQLPHYSQKISREMRKYGARDLESLLLLDDIALEAVCRDLTPTSVKDVFLFRDMFPFLDVKAKLHVKGARAGDTSRITAESFVTFVVSLTRYTSSEMRQVIADRKTKATAAASKGDTKAAAEAVKAEPPPTTTTTSSDSADNKKGSQKDAKKPQKGGKASKESDEEGSDVDEQRDAGDGDDVEEIERAMEQAAMASIDSESIDSSAHNTHKVHAPFYSGEKFEGWWVYLSNPLTNTIESQIRFVNNLQTSVSIQLETMAGAPGTYKFVLNVVSDSYLGLTHTIPIKMHVGAKEKEEEIVREVDEDDLDDDINSSDEEIDEEEDEGSDASNKLSDDDTD